MVEILDKRLNTILNDFLNTLNKNSCNTCSYYFNKNNSRNSFICLKKPNMGLSKKYRCSYYVGIDKPTTNKDYTATEKGIRYE